MEQEQKSPCEESLVSKNKGGRPRKTLPYYNRKVTIYLSDEEYESLHEFASLASYSLSISGAARFILLDKLMDWRKKGRRKIGVYGKYE